MKTFVIALLSGCAIMLLMSLWGFYAAIRPFKIISTATPRDFGLAYENILFQTTDQVVIRGWFIKHPNPQAKTIIILHGYPADKGNLLPISIFLHKKYNLLYFDFRYLGESGGAYSTIGKNEVLDLQAAIQYLRSRNIHEVGIWGFSLGGAVALMAAPETPAIKAIVAEASYARLDWLSYDYYQLPVLKYMLGELTRFWAWLLLGYDIQAVSPVLAAEKITIPVLLIHSKQDHVIPFAHALALEQALKQDRQLEVLFTDETLHGEHLISHDQAILAFFDKYLSS